MSRALHTRLQLGVAGTIFIAWFLAGAAIFALPELFYKVVPGVKLFGPFNAHFIRDVGLVYLASGVIGLYGLRSGSSELCIAGALWSCLHGLFHLDLWWHRGFPADGIFLFDLGFVIAPPFLVLVPATLGLLRRETRS